GAHFQRAVSVAHSRCYPCVQTINSGYLEVRAREVRVSEIRAPQVRIGETRARQVRVGEVRAPQVRAPTSRCASEPQLVFSEYREQFDHRVHPFFANLASIASMVSRVLRVN